jgi:transposase
MSKKKEESQMVAELQKQISQLKGSLAYSRMKNDALETMINLAEKEFRIQIRKKSGTKQ